jgi:hypothetical protein
MKEAPIAPSVVKTKRIGEREIIIPILFPPLRKEPKAFSEEVDNSKQFKDICNIAYNLQKSKDEGIFKILLKENSNSSMQIKRSLYFKELVNSMEGYFPMELKQDKLPKRQNVKKIASLEHMARESELLSKKREQEKVKQEKQAENQKYKDNKLKAQSKSKNSEEKKKPEDEVVDKLNLIEDIYIKKKDSLYYERHRRDSLDMVEFRLNNFKEKQLDNTKLIQDDESVVEENKSAEEESFNDEYRGESDGENFGSDEEDKGGEGGYSDY